MSEQLQRRQLIEQLMRMLDTISQNAGYLRYFENENALIDPKIYFDICQIIFSELSIKLIKIQEYEGYDDGEKLDCLIKLITDQLGIYMPGLSGKQIMKFNIPHIYQFLNLLLEYSKLYFQRGSAALQPSVRTQPNEISADYDGRDNNHSRNPFSARPPGIVGYSPKSSSQQATHQNGSKPFKQNNKHTKNKSSDKVDSAFAKVKEIDQGQVKENHRPKSALPQKKKKSQQLYDQLVKVVIDQKNRANKSSLRDQRKNKNQDLQQARKKYHQYLKSYSKHKRAQTQRKSFLKKRSQTIYENSNQRQLPLKDFQNVSNFFKSFNLKLRDMKDVYIRRMKKQIRIKEQEKMVFRNKLQRENKSMIEKMIAQEIQCLNNEHHLRKSEIKQAAAQLEEEIFLVQKQMKRKSSQRKKQLKESKKQNLNNLKNMIRQQNQRILMELEAGGRMQKLILQAYGKF